MVILVDTGNIYHCLKKFHSGMRLDYKAFYSDLGNHMVAYGAIATKASLNFMGILRDIGYSLHFKKLNKIQPYYSPIIDMTLFALEHIGEVGFATSNVQILPLLQHLRDKHNYVAPLYSIKTHPLILVNDFVPISMEKWICNYSHKNETTPASSPVSQCAQE